MPTFWTKLRGAFHREKPTSGTSPAKASGHRRRWRWVSLIGGAALILGAYYFWYTSARLLSEPIRIDYGPTHASFANAIGPMTGADFTEGNQIETLINGDEFFPPMLRAIREARQTITLETYIWTSGKISDEFIAALTERARAGVKVHALLDGVGGMKLGRADRDRLAEAGVQLTIYGREHWWQVKPNINHRTHRKLLIVDGRIGFMGGMCIDDSWLGDAKVKDLWRETMVRVEGPAVRQMQAVFAQNWLQTTASLLLGEEYFPKLPKSGSSTAHCYKSGPDEGPEVARLGYLFAIASARKSIELSHAYFVPDNLAIDLLLEAIARGVRIRVIAPAINDSKLGRSASRSRWGKLLAAGVEFYLFQPAMYHCKTMIVDDVLVTVGSANFDNRSFSINDEVTLTALDRAVAADHLRVFADDLKKSKRLTQEEFVARPFYIKAIDHLAGLFRSQF